MGKKRESRGSRVSTGAAKATVGVLSFLFYLTVGALKVTTKIIAFPFVIGYKLILRRRCRKVLAGGMYMYPCQVDNVKRNMNDFVGVYILHNIDNNKYYVGQSVHVLKRLTQHFNGKGCEDVYRDYCRGMNFEIQCIALVNSGYNNLNKLERDYIAYYDAYNRGYNKTRGNHD